MGSSVPPPEVPSEPPRWLRLAPFLGRPPQLTRHQWTVLGLVSIVSLFEQYDLYLFSLNLRHIQADLGIAEGQLGALGSIVRFGSLAAVLIALAADRLGRRRILLATVVLYTLLTGATAFAPDATTFVVLQFLARAFATAETLLAVVVIAEEFAPEHRGWGIGALGAIQACGAGLAALAFGFVDVLPYGWRALYALGLIPLGLVAYWRRNLPETARFERMRRESRAPPTLSIEPAVDLVRTYPARFVALALVVFVIGLATAPAAFFAPKYLQDVHGWAPGWVASLNFLGGAFAIVGNPLAGRLSDRHGRRPIAMLFTAGFGLVTIAFYTAMGLLTPALWILLIFTMMGSEVTLSAYGAELFPTSQRSTASGARSAASNAGAVAGLALVSVLFSALGSNWAAIIALACLCLIAPLLIRVSFPETARRTLEEIAPERPAAGPVRAHAEHEAAASLRARSDAAHGARR
jgi:MFS family permease